MNDAPTAGLRERKKQAARQTIVQVSNRMFRERGYDAVTLEQIADGCTMSVRTILRYFGTKEELALAPEHAARDEFTATLTERDTDAVSVWRAFVAEMVQQMTENPAESRRRMTEIMSHPALHAEFLRIGHDYEDMLTAAIDSEDGGADPLRSRLYATVLVAGVRATFREWISTEDFDLGVLVEVVDYASERFGSTFAGPNFMK